MSKTTTTNSSDDQPLHEHHHFHHQSRRWAVLGLLAYSLLALTAVTVLSWHGDQVPESLIATLSMAVGALGGLAAK